VEAAGEPERRVPPVLLDELVDEGLVGEPPPQPVVERRAPVRRARLLEEDLAAVQDSFQNEALCRWGEA